MAWESAPIEVGVAGLPSSRPLQCHQTEAQKQHQASCGEFSLLIWITGTVGGHYLAWAAAGGTRMEEEFPASARDTIRDPVGQVVAWAQGGVAGGWVGQPCPFASSPWSAGPFGFSARQLAAHSKVHINGKREEEQDVRRREEKENKQCV